MPITVSPTPNLGTAAGPETDNPAFSGRSWSPVLTSINPFTVLVGSGSQTLHVLGSNFTAASKIWLNGALQTTTFVNSGDITCTLLPSGLGVGNWSVQVKGTSGNTGTTYLEVT